MDPATFATFATLFTVGALVFAFVASCFAAYFMDWLIQNDKRVGDVLDNLYGLRKRRKKRARKYDVAARKPPPRRDPAILPIGDDFPGPTSRPTTGTWKYCGLAYILAREHQARVRLFQHVETKEIRTGGNLKGFGHLTYEAVADAFYVKNPPPPGCEDAE